MKKFVYATLLLSFSQSLYLMDDEKNVQKIAHCIKKCADDYWDDLQDVSHKRPIQACTDICTTIFSCKEKAKERQKQTRELVAAIESLKKTN